MRTRERRYGRLWAPARVLRVCSVGANCLRDAAVYPVMCC